MGKPHLSAAEPGALLDSPGGTREDPGSLCLWPRGAVGSGNPWLRSARGVCMRRKPLSVPGPPSVLSSPSGWVAEELCRLGLLLARAVLRDVRCVGPFGDHNCPVDSFYPIL